jgi:hypothetical protein
VPGQLPAAVLPGLVLTAAGVGLAILATSAAAATDGHGPTDHRRAPAQLEIGLYYGSRTTG